MSRYCFYCGRELTVGERCHCKDPAREDKYQTSGSANKDKSAQASGNTGFAGAFSGTSAGASSGAKSGTGGSSSGAKSRFSSKTRHGKASGSRKNTRAGSGYFAKISRMQSFFGRLRTFSDQIRTLFPNITKSAGSGIQYITRPASKIRQESMRVKRAYSHVLIVVFSLMSGLLALLMSRSGAPLFTNMLSVVFGQEQTLLYSHPVQSFFGLSIFCFLCVIIMAVSFYVAARFSNRKPSFRKVLDLISISLIYLFIMEVYVLITILMGSRGSLSLLFISLLLMGITQFLSFRNALGLTEDTVFFFLIFVYIFCYILYKLLLYFTIQLCLLL